MKQQSPYADANVNSYVASQMQQMSTQRMQQNSSMSNYSGRPDSFPPREEERQYASAEPEAKWQWDRDAQQMSPHLYSEGQGGNPSRSFYQNQVPDPKRGSHQESRGRAQEQNMEVGYEDNPSPYSLEGLERKFHDDVMKLMKEQIDAEDEENARHREKIIEINNQYQENLSTLRTRHATRREEFLQRESRARLEQYQVAVMSHLQAYMGPPSEMGHLEYGAAMHQAPAEAQRPYSSGQFDSYRQRSGPYGRGRVQGANARVSTPGSRQHNAGPRFY